LLGTKGYAVVVGWIFTILCFALPTGRVAFVQNTRRNQAFTSTQAAILYSMSIFARTLARLKTWMSGWNKFPLYCICSLYPCNVIDI
jgi:hypothetical protein